MNRFSKKGVAVGLLFVLVAAMFVIVLPMNVSAEYMGTVFINSDGTFTSGAPLSVSGNTYQLTDDIKGNLVIQKSGITVNGMGYDVHDGPANGVIFWGVSGVTVMKTCAALDV